jgi:hypothetical protein
MTSASRQLKAAPVEFEVGAMRRDEARAVARLHHQWFGPALGRGSSLAMLGEDWLARAFYGANFANPHQGVQVARWAGRVVGFMHYAIDRRRIARWTLAHAAPALVGATLRAIVRRPAVLRHLLGNLVYVGGEELSFLAESDAHWTLFAVEPEFRSKEWERETGIWVAGAMLEVMEADMRARGVRAWYAAPAPDNPPINKFMERVGAFRVGTARAQGIELLYWRKLLSPP